MGLNNAFPDLLSEDDLLVPIEGSPPNLIDPPDGCRFKARCPFSLDTCDKKPIREYLENREVICWRQSESLFLRNESKKTSTWQTNE